MAVVVTTRRFVLQAVHRLDSLNEGPHGHHFFIEISFKDCEPATIESAFHELIYKRLHGRDLSEVLETPTGEALAQWIHEVLLRSSIRRHLVGVAVQETEKNRFISSMTEARHV